jgi:phosphopentomutase
MRAILLVLDSVGVGALPDAAAWGDAGADTLGHLARAVGGVRLPHLGALGLGNIHEILGVPPTSSPRAAFGRMATCSEGKDTVTGHWEMAGCLVPRAFGVFPDGFPREILDPFEAFAGSPVLGNKAASGTAILEELGPEHLRTRRPIVYTSADSVFQIAAHEDILPPPELYTLCERAFEIVASYRVARVIARPFVGAPGAFKRTGNRKDFALVPHAETVMDRLFAAGLPVVSVGKVANVFGHRGFTEEVKASGNMRILDATLGVMERLDHGMIFSNLVDFDMEYGHRRDPVGYARALEAFDTRVPELLDRLRPDDLLLIQADHGNDPCHPGSDHTREWVPLLALGPRRRTPDLGSRRQQADSGATLAEHLGVVPLATGESFLGDL